MQGAWKPHQAWDGVHSPWLLGLIHFMTRAFVVHEMRRSISRTTQHVHMGDRCPLSSAKWRMERQSDGSGNYRRMCSLLRAFTWS